LREVAGLNGLIGAQQIARRAILNGILKTNKKATASQAGS
jgi:hypothetical protein